MHAPTSTAAQQQTGLLAEYDVLLSNLRDAHTTRIDTDNTFLSPQAFSPLAREFDKGREHIAKLARSLGAEVPEGHHLSLTHVLKYYGCAVSRPQSSALLARLIRQVEEKKANLQLGLEQGPDLGTLLSADDRQDIENEISLVLGDEDTPIIDRLVREAGPDLTLEALRRTPETCLLRLLDSHKARYLTQRLIAVLGWYGAGPGEQTAEGLGIRLLAEALRVWYRPSAEEPSGTIAGYRLQQNANHGKSYNQIRSEFEDYLLESGRVTTHLEKIVLARLLLRDFPLEFQVRDIPADLPYATSVVWVNFAHGTRLAHALDPQLLQRLTFQQLVDLPLGKSANAAAAMLDLIALTRTAAAREWVLAAGVVEQSDDTAAQATSQPIAALDKYTAQLNAAIVQIAEEAPQRLDLTKKLLLEKFGDSDRVTNPYKMTLMRSSGYAGNRSRRVIIDTDDKPGPFYPFVDVYASGGLTPDTRWFVDKDRSTKDVWISLSAEGLLQAGYTIKRDPPPLPLNIQQKILPNISQVFTTQFNSHLDKSKKAYEVLIKHQLVTLPWADRKALEQGEVRIYTLREETKRPASEETEDMRWALRARMGFVLRADYAGKSYFYECLPRAGVIRLLANFSASKIGGVHDYVPAPYLLGLDTDYLPAVGARLLPFDWQAYKNGTQPQKGATCRAILEQLGDTLKHQQTFPLIHHDNIPNLTLTSSRSREIAAFISRQLFYVDEKQLRTNAWGETQFERDRDKPDWIYSLKPFIPFWGSLDDLKSDKFGDRVLGVIGLIVDVVSFAIPLGKFAAGSIRLAATAGRMGIRATLPAMGKLSSTFVTATLRNLNPLDALPGLARATFRGIRAGGRALGHLHNKAMFKLKKLAGSAAEYDFVHGLPQVGDAAHWRPLTDADQLAMVKGIEDVPVRNVSLVGERHYLLDPLSSRPYGPLLTPQAHDLSLGRSSFPTVKKADEQVFVELSEKARVREMLEIDGRTTMLIDDLPYRLDGDQLRRVDLIDDSDAFKLLPCRPRRAPIDSHECLNSFVTSEMAPTPATGSVDESPDYAPWFGDRISEPAARPGHAGQFLTHEGNVYQITEGVPSLYKGDFTELGFAKTWLVPSREIPGSLLFRKGIYGRLEVKGVYEGAEDSHKIGAILVPSLDETSTHVFTRINTDKYYLATVPKGQDLSEPLTMKRLFKADMAKGTLGDELLVVYTGSLNANNVARIYSVDAIERAIRTMEQIAVPIGTQPFPPAAMKHVKVGTTPGQALMFDRSTRMIVTKLDKGATSWSRSSEAPEDLRQRTAHIFNTLFLEPTIDASTVNSALEINKTMAKLKRLTPMYQRSRNARNIAYAEVTTTAGRKEIYVSVSGGQQSTGHLPLFKQNPGADQIRVGDADYFNIDMNRAFPRESLDLTAQDNLLAVPDTIKDVGTYTPALTAKPTSLDSESKLIRVIREKYPDRASIVSIDVATTMEPCQSCSIVLKEFGNDGGPNALRVLWE